MDVSSSGMSQETFLGAGSFLVVVTGAVVAVRLVASLRISGSLHSDDYVSVAAVLSMAASFAVFFEFSRLYSDPRYMLKLRIISQACLSPRCGIIFATI